MAQRQSRYSLDFEKPIAELEYKIEELRELTAREGVDFENEIKSLQARLRKLQEDTFLNLTPWQKVQLARHPNRPKFLDLVKLVFDNFLSLHGDRLYADDQAIVGGLAKMGSEKMLIIGHQKGESVKENLFRNFGMAHPEGYRKSQRLMDLAEKFSRPLITFIDTPGAYPGVEAEQRGQAEAIADNLERMAQLKVPFLTIIVGEGGSGGALGIGMGDKVLMLENAIYSVISPEGCAAILWKDQTKVEEAAKVLRLTSQELLKLRLIDGIIPEPRGGAHRNIEEVAINIKQAIIDYLEEVKGLSGEDLVQKRYERYRKIGRFKEKSNKNSEGENGRIRS
ncbi:MAG: acetyl-CoA carboxylase carboxyltransferase subunit alpha [Candidatus Aerophobetes bacterium]|nr:acetyl-CoA carboxylase carboxyltransferase subunit alpha [Candidatus Aerophobetes bacterium]